MTFAYLILAHKNPNQVLRLVNILAANNTYFFIHADKKADETLFKSVVGSHENVFFCECRKTVNWGGFSVHPFFAYMRDMFLEYWSKTNGLIDYFLIDYCIIVGYDKIPVIRNAINKISYSNPQVFGLAQKFGQRI
jgi:hypothetical protein